MKEVTHSTGNLQSGGSTLCFSIWNRKPYYQDLKVSQKGMELTTFVYRIAMLFPKEEMFGLSSQMRRCAVSIPSNIAEGRGRKSKKEFIHFLYIALGFCNEAETQAIVAKELSCISKGEFTGIMKLCQDLRKVLNGLINHCQKTLAPPKSASNFPPGC